MDERPQRWRFRIFFLIQLDLWKLFSLLEAAEGSCILHTNLLRLGLLDTFPVQARRQRPGSLFGTRLFVIERQRGQLTALPFFIFGTGLGSNSLILGAARLC